MTEFVFYEELRNGDCPTYSAHKAETLEQAVRLFCEGQGKYINDVMVGIRAGAIVQKFGTLEVRWPGPTLWVVPPLRLPSSFASWTWCKEPALLWKLLHNHAYGNRNVHLAFREAEGWRTR